MTAADNHFVPAIARSSGQAVGVAALACLAAYWLTPPASPPASPAVAVAPRPVPPRPAPASATIADDSAGLAATVVPDATQTERLAALSAAIAGYPVIKRMVDSAMSDGRMDDQEHGAITNRLDRIKRNQAERNKRRFRNRRR